VVTWIGVHQLGYAEFGEMQRHPALRVGNQRRAMGNNIYVASLVQRFRRHADPPHLWKVSSSVARLEFHRLEITFERRRPTCKRPSGMVADRAEERNQPSSQWRIPVDEEGEVLATIVVTRSLQKQVEFDPTYLLTRSV